MKVPKKTYKMIAIDELERSRGVNLNNAPINEREGNLRQAKLERDNAEAYKLAIDILKGK